MSHLRDDHKINCRMVSVQHFIIEASGVHRGGGAGGARAPAPLRSDTKVPLQSGLCDMNDIVDEENQYRRSLYAEYAVCLGHQLAGGHHPSCSKKMKM